MTTRWDVFDDGCNHGFGYVRSVILNTTGPYTTKQYQLAGSPPAERWRFDHGAQTLAIAAKNDRVAIGGVAHSFGGVTTTTRLLDFNGRQIWGVNHGAKVNAVAIDGSDNVITGGDPASFLAVRKYDPDGNLLWSRASDPASFIVPSVAVDASGNVYAGNPAGPFDPPVIQKWDADGNLLWKESTAFDNQGIGRIVAFGGLLIFGTGQGGDQDAKTLHVWDADDGSEVWSIEAPVGIGGASLRSVTAVAVDGGGNIAIGGSVTGETPVVQHFDSSGNLNWSREHVPNSVASVSFDAAGNVIAAGGNLTTGVNVQKWDPDGDLLWNFRWTGNSQSGFPRATLAPDGRLYVTGDRVT